MINNLRVGIPIIGSSIWWGGVTYIELLVKAIRALPQHEQPSLTLVIDETRLAAVSLHENILPLFDGIIFVGQNIEEAKKVIARQLIPVASMAELYSHIDFFYPVQANVWPDFCSASWIPDFQHIYLPEFFSQDEIRMRNSAFARIADSARLLVLSSHDAERDFRRLYPRAKPVIRILSFHAAMPPDILNFDPIKIQRKYKLPDKFLICCNQFWAHKNHLLLFETIADLHRADQPVHLVCTGPTNDYRFPHYFSQIQDKLYNLKINDYVHIMGVLPRNEQLQLMRRAMAVIQPSLFEGWSTVIEDARSLGKVLILSDLPVHKEQAPENAVFFERTSSVDLTKKIAQVLPNLVPGPDPLMEKRARTQSEKLVRLFARQFCAIALEAQTLFGKQSQSKRYVLPIEPLETVRATSGTRKSPIKVSAIVSTYNSERFMRGCLEDLVNQTLYKKGQLEIVVIDSGSEQNEKAIVEEFQKNYENIIYLRTQRETVYAAWNRGIKLASGVYITNANTDDRHRHDALELLADTLDKNPNVGLVYPDVVITATENETFDHHTPVGAYRWMDYARELLALGCFMGPQPMWRKSLHDKYGYFDESFTSSGDWEFWLRIAEDTQMLHVPEFLGLYLFDPRSAEHRDPVQRNKEDERIRNTYARKYLGTVEDIDRGLAALQEMEKKTGDGRPFEGWRRALLQLRQHLYSTKTAPIPVEEKSVSRESFFHPFSAEKTVATSSQFATVAEEKEKTESSSQPLSIIFLLSGERAFARRSVESLCGTIGVPHKMIFTPLTQNYSPPKWLRKILKNNPSYTLVAPSSESKDLSLPSLLNRALSHASGAQIVVIEDSVILTDGWIEGLLEHLNKSDDIGIVGPMVVGGDGVQGVKIQGSRGQGVEDSSGIRQRPPTSVKGGKEGFSKEKFRTSRNDTYWEHSTLEPLDPAFLDGFAREYRERFRHRHIPAKTLDRSCFAMKRAVFEQAGPFDERFLTASYAIEDFCLRASIAGYRTAIAGDVVIGIQSRPDEPSMNKKSFTDKRSYIAKWSNPAQAHIDMNKLAAANILTASRDFAEKGEYEKAATVLIEGLKQAPDDERLHFALVELLLEKGKFMDADEVLTRMPDHLKEKPRWMELAGECAVGLQAYGKAEIYADRLLAIDAASARALNLKGTIAFHRRTYGEAEKLFESAIAADAGFAEAYANLGALKWTLKETDAGFKFIEKAFLLAPTVESIAMNYHATAVSLSRLQDAETQFGEAVRRHPTHKKLTYMFADVLLQNGKYQDAMDVIEKALLTFGMDNDSLTLGGALREKIGPLEIKTKGPRGREVADSSGAEKIIPTLAKGGQGGFSQERFRTSRNDIHLDPRTRVATSESPGRETSAPTLSVCMIVKDEEKNIGKCLHKIKPLADEIIVVDTGSTDRTKEIAKIFGAKVYDFAWTESFAEARNYSLSKATGDWIFVLDADETIAPSDFEKIRELIEKESRGRGIPSRAGGRGAKDSREYSSVNQSAPGTLESSASGKVVYTFTTRNYVVPITTFGWIGNDGSYLDEEAGTGWFSSKKVRLFPNDERIRFESPVHEFVELSVANAGYSIVDSPVPVHHYGKLDAKKLTAKAVQYYELGKAKWYERGVDDPVALCELAIQALELNKYEEAVDWWQKLIAVRPDYWKAHYGLANAYLKLGRFEEAYHAVLKSLETVQNDTDWRDAVVLYAYSALYSGRAEESVTVINQLMKKYPDDPLGSMLLATAYLLSGMKREGLDLLEALRTKHYGAGEFLDQAAKHFIEHGNYASARVLLRASEKAHMMTGDTLSLIAECERKAREAETQRDTLSKDFTPFHSSSPKEGENRQRDGIYRGDVIARRTPASGGTTTRQSRPDTKDEIALPPQASRWLDKESGEHASEERFRTSRNDIHLDPRTRIATSELPGRESSAPTLSVCMIVKNEEQNIGRALESVKPIADEIIVVDTGSTDRTKEIAQEMGAKVYDFAWTDSFAEARNYSLSKATGDWILILDADEVISPKDHENLRALIGPLKGDTQRDRHDPPTAGLAMTDSESSRDRVVAGSSIATVPSRQSQSGKDSRVDLRTLDLSNPNARAYLLTTRNYVTPMNVDGWVANDGSYPGEETGSGWFGGEKVRLFPNDGRIRFEYPVHERVEPVLERIGIPIQRSDIVIHHYGKLDEEKRHAKNEYYYSLGKKKLAELGDRDYRSLYDLAVQASGIGRYREAISLLQRVISLNPDFARAYSSMGNVYYNLGRYHDALEAYRAAVERDPESRDATIMRAQCELIAGDPAMAREQLESILRQNPSFEKALLLLIAALFVTGDRDEAMERADAFSARRDFLIQYLSEFAQLFTSLGKTAEAQLLREAAEDMRLRGLLNI